MLNSPLHASTLANPYYSNDQIFQSIGAADVALTAKGASGQTANIFEVVNSSGSVLFAVDPTGDLTIAGGVVISIDDIVTGNVSVGGNLSVTGDSVLSGDVTLGTSEADTLTINSISKQYGDAWFYQPARFQSSVYLNNLVFLGTFTQGSVLFTGNGGQISQDNSNLFWDDTNNRLGIGTSASPSHTFHISKTMTDTVSAAYFGATFPDTISASMRAVNIQAVSAGSSAFAQLALTVNMAAGYTGSSSTYAIEAINNTAGTGITPITADMANFGVYGAVGGTTNGTGIGIFGSSANNLKNFGVMGRTITNKNSGTNVGGAFYSLNGGSSPTQVGVVAALAGAEVTYASTALLVDNVAQTSPIAIFRDNGTAVFTIGDVATTHVVNLAAGTLTDGYSALYLSATMPTTITAARYAVNYQITSAGSSSQRNVGLNVDYLGGYTGNNQTAAARFINQAAGTGTNPFSDTGNSGFIGGAAVTTTGTNTGAVCIAQYGNLNAGVWGQAIVTKNSATNIGVVGFGRNTGTSPIQIGGFFGLHASTPTFASAALMADNSDQTSNIFVARDNGTAVFTVGDIATTHAVNIAGGSIASSMSALYVSGTKTMSSGVVCYGVDFEITGGGSFAGNNAAFNVNYLAGYTGSAGSYAARIINLNVGTGTTPLVGGSTFANVGVVAGAIGTTAGTNVGFSCYSYGGNTNFGVIGETTTAKNGATNIGILGLGLNTGTSPTQVGGFFGLMATEPTYSSCALCADNGTTTSNIFVARDNGTAVFTIPDGGNVVVGAGEAGTPVAQTLRGPNATGTNIAGVATTFAASLATGTGNQGTLAFTASGTKQATGATAQSAATYLTIGHSQSAHPSTAGALIDAPTVTWTDYNTAGSGTAAQVSAYAFAAPTFAATNALVTTTGAATVYIAGAPAAGTNMTLSNAYALWVAAGSVRFDGGVVFNSDVDWVLAGSENITINNTTNTLAAAGMFDLSATTSTSDTRTLNVVTTNTATTGNTSYSIYNSMASTAVVTGTVHEMYGVYNSVSKTGAESSGDAINIYGQYTTVTHTGSTDTGTRNTYGGYFTVAGDGAGTSTVYGLYVTASGGDTNYAIYSASGINYFAGGARIDGTLNLGVDNTVGYIEIHDAGTLKFWDDGDDTSVTLGPTSDGTTTLGITGGLNVSSYSAFGMTAAPTSGVVLFVGANGTTMPAATTAWRDLQTGGNVTELANATITDIVGAYFNTFTVTDGGGTETVGILSTVYIAGAPTAGSTPTNGPYALFVDAGNTRLDGLLILAPTTTGNCIDFQLETEWTTGSVINVDFASSTTQSGDVTGLNLDFNTNLAGVTDKDTNGIILKTQALTQSAANTTTYNGFWIPTAGALVQDTAAGTINWYGLNIQMPNITQTTGDVNSFGLKITGGTVTSGDARAIDITLTDAAVVGHTAYSVYNSLASTAVVTGTSHYLYGDYITVSKTGADTSVADINVYGQYVTVNQTGSTDAGVRNTYGGYFTVTGDTAGTATAYGIYTTAAGADTNYGIYSAAGLNAFVGSVLIGGATQEAGSAGTLCIMNGTAPDAHVDNEIQIYSVDSSDATATLALFLEQAVEDVGTFTATHKIKVLVNGVEYWISLDSVA